MRWEYKRINVEIADVSDDDFEAQLNELGDDGWELVLAIDHQRHGFSKVLHIIFKRSPGELARLGQGDPVALAR